MFRRACRCFILLSLLSSYVVAEEYQVEVIQETAPEGELSAEVLATLSETGLRVSSDAGRAVCEIWLCKNWTVKEGFAASPDLLYPFEPGDLIGVIRLPRRGSDFREQSISRGVYTLRYAQQPVDGNHVGTSPTRDFLLLSQAESDQAVARVEADPLNEASAEAAGSSHPAMMCLQRVTDDQAGPAVRHDEANDWWILRFSGKAVAGSNETNLSVDLVVVGHAHE